MAKGNNALLIFDFDNTITNEHMHNVFSRLGKSDFDSTQNNAVTDVDIRKFLENTDGIKNAEGLKSVLRSALSNGVKVNIASYTKYPNAVKKVAKDYLGLSKEQADSVSVFGGFPKSYDPKLQEDQQNQVGKNLHICRAIAEYKNKHNGQLPKTVMLVDDSAGNIKKINEFIESMSKREGWLEKNGLSIEEIQKIRFEGVRVLKEDKNVDYLGKVQKFINTSLIQEPIYENLRKEDPIYQNLQDIQNALKVQAEPVHQSVSSSLPQTRKSDSDIAVDGENKKQDIKDMSSSKAQAKPTHSRRHAMILDPQQVKSALQNTEELSPGKKYAHTQTFSLFREIKSIKQWFKGCAKEIIDAMCNLFKKEVVTKLKGQGYAVSSEQGNDGIIVSSNELIYAPKINKDIIVESLKQVMDNKEGIRALGNNYKGGQLEQEISKLLNADLQKENINSNSVGVNHEEPIFQTCEETLISHQQIRGNYNNREPIFQTREEALRGDSQKKNANSSRRPLPSLPPKSRMEEVKTEGKTKTVEKS
ncbi:MAG: hypothetical protein LBU56_05540 [Rickettsiales bacterium]|jgi:hypothetical protein|nr:hypothetical protein [Rickettsiales bacterium]